MSPYDMIAGDTSRVRHRHHPGSNAIREHLPIIPSLCQLLEILLSMRPNLNDGTTLDERRDLLPSLAVLFESS